MQLNQTFKIERKYPQCQNWNLRKHKEKKLKQMIKNKQHPWEYLYFSFRRMDKAMKTCARSCKLNYNLYFVSFASHPKFSFRNLQ